eukprot:TRINITY_DN5086_c0_g1_i1.p1 TRINITY_DN5086_c0_g1~~TRINITY_DN5086_c0_g1_i1.p1  ORF type:complete len:158 (-),score=18.22 TRINITY_DN5086_c0_g1_i1:71-544(-)
MTKKLRVFRCCGLASIGNTGVNIHRWWVSEWLGGSFARKVIWGILFPLWAALWLMFTLFGFVIDFIIFIVWGITACCFRTCVPENTKQTGCFEMKDVEVPCHYCSIHLGCVVADEETEDKWEKATCGDVFSNCMRKGTPCCSDGGDKDGGSGSKQYY